MELKDIMQRFLPREVAELFEIVKIDDDPTQWKMDIYLDERKVVPKQLDNTSEKQIYVLGLNERCKLLVV